MLCFQQFELFQIFQRMIVYQQPTKSLTYIYIKMSSISQLLKLVCLLAFILIITPWCQITHFAENKKINELDVSPDGLFLLTASDSNAMTIWNTSNFQPIYTYNINIPVLSAKFSKDQLFIGITYAQNNINILSISGSTFAFSRSITTTHGTVNEIDWSSDHLYFITCGTDGNTQVWKRSNWGTFTSFSTNSSRSVNSCRFSLANRIVMGDINGGLYMYRVTGGGTSWSSSYSDGTITQAINQIDWNPTNSSYYVTSSSMSVYNFPSSGGGGPNFLQNIGSITYALAVSKDGNDFVVGDAAGVIRIYDATSTSTFILTASDRYQAFPVRAAVFSYDSATMYIANDAGIVYVYSKTCKGCPVGKYDSGLGICLYCSSTIAGCQICTNGTVCLACANGYAYNSTSSKCSRCESYLTNCVDCKSSSVCTQCALSYYLQGNTCSRCSSLNCLTCTNSTYCLTCNQNYYLDVSTHLCVSCNLITNCLSCTASNYCISCIRNYYQSAGQCLPCSTSCTTCVNSTYCNQCVNGMYSNSGTCTYCITDCLICMNGTGCTSCMAGRYNNGSVCLSCTSNCLSCSSVSLCNTCASGYYLLANSTCTPCLSGCMTCTASSTCLSCNVGFYYLSASKTCNKCQNLAANCRECSNSTCLLCELGYFYNSINTSCIQCPSNCLSCTNSSYCQTCSTFSTRLVNGTCLNCPTGCSACSSSTNCVNCLPRYYFSSSSCLLCPSGCLTCINSTSCLSCVEGKYPSSGSCATCNSSIIHCSRCYNSTYCSSCQVGYYLSATNGTCSSCAWPCSSCNITACFSCNMAFYLTAGICYNCPIACSECQSNLKCVQCANGYYLESSNFTCISCSLVSTGCEICLSSSVCLKCLSIESYYLDSTQKCSKCLNAITNCRQCTNNLTCDKCIFGYYLSSSNQSCSSCSIINNCVSCLNSSNCISCLTGYYLSSNSCSICSTGCFDCNSSTVCLQCLNGFVLQGTTCTYCRDLILGCQVCTSNSVCIKCNNQYYVNGNSCSPCNFLMEGCSICSSGSVCLYCQDSYYYNTTTSQCNLCSTSLSGCQLCNQSSVCLNCEGGYYLQSNYTCQACTDKNCIQCSASVCFLCKSGLYLNGTSCTQCSSNYLGCLTCNSTKCIQCQTGYYLSSTGFCNNCNQNGCQICSNILPLTQCLTCNSLYYLTAAKTCILCKANLTACINCISATQCLSCQTGYYTNGNTCTLCSIQFAACLDCTISQCFSCQGGYILNASTCVPCLTYLPGCSYCKSQINCLACQSGYFLNGSQCLLCQSLVGCLTCQNATSCTLCSTKYYLQSGSCMACNSSLVGCIECTSLSTCISCEGSYSLTGGICGQIVVNSALPYKQLFFNSQYVSDYKLKHCLKIRNSTFKQVNLNWSAEVNINMFDQSSNILNLTIQSAQWVSLYALCFFTNNPLKLQSDSSLFKSMKAFRRLQESNLNFDSVFQIKVSQTAVQSIFPDSTHLGSLSLKYDTSNPEFYASVTKLQSFHLYLIGLLITLFMIVNYFIKAVVSVPQSLNQGQLIPHVLSLKCVALVYFPTYFQVINFCYGFMTIQLPWLNEYFGNELSSETDISPSSYILFYKNMNIASTYLLGTCAIILIVISLIILKKIVKSFDISSLATYLYNLFICGFAFSSLASIVGTYYNPITSLSINGVFYILGIIFYVVLVVEAIFSTFINKSNLFKIRIIFKITVLSLLYLSPIYLLPVFVGIESLFIFLEYQINSTTKFRPKMWLISQILVNCALTLMLLFPTFFLSMFFATALILAALIVDFLIHIQQFRHFKLLNEVQETEKVANVLKLNTTQCQNDNNNTFFKKTRSFKENKNENFISEISEPDIKQQESFPKPGSFFRKPTSNQFILADIYNSFSEQKDEIKKEKNHQIDKQI